VYVWDRGTFGESGADATERGGEDDRDGTGWYHRVAGLGSCGGGGSEDGDGDVLGFGRGMRGGGGGE